eukprot:TRINITY_DN42751_c0_g1_i1.p1 TRINITY_DN42751_c0_g1~~TRINITY_DN42751_c0_g1_i1.p1  ORF type:complete len:899 (+),score=219.36 TRINITY_DN42751_c0_g1_i1:212-2698(+)
MVEPVSIDIPACSAPDGGALLAAGGGGAEGPQHAAGLDTPRAAKALPPPSEGGDEDAGDSAPRPPSPPAPAARSPSPPEAPGGCAGGPALRTPTPAAAAAYAPPSSECSASARARVHEILKLLGDGAALRGPAAAAWRRHAAPPHPAEPLTEPVLRAYYAALDSNALQRDWDPSAEWAAADCGAAPPTPEAMVEPVSIDIPACSAPDGGALLAAGGGGAEGPQHAAGLDTPRAAKALPPPSEGGDEDAGDSAPRPPSPPAPAARSPSPPEAPGGCAGGPALRTPTPAAAAAYAPPSSECSASARARVHEILKLLGDGAALRGPAAAAWRRHAAPPHPAEPLTEPVLRAYYAALDSNALQRDWELAVWAAEGGLPSGRCGPVWQGHERDGCVMRGLKRHSVLNELFFRPPIPHYDARQPDLVFVPCCAAHDTDGLPDWLPALWLPHTRARGVMIFCHGNACDIQESPIVQSYRRAFGLSVLALEWPGYGLAGGYPTEHNLTAAVLSAVIFLRRALCVDPNRIVLHGRSLGTGPCIAAADVLERQGHPVAALFLKSAYTSWKGIIRSQGEPGSVVRCLCSAAAGLFVDRFPSADIIPRVTCPVLLVHGERDCIIPASHSARLFELAGCPREEKHLVLAPRGCHDHGLEMWCETREFLARLPLAPLPLPCRLPADCYRVAYHAGRSQRERRRRRLQRIALPACIALCGCGVGAVGALAEFRAGSCCRPLLRIWLFLHAGVLLCAAAVRACADWTKDDLARSQDQRIVAGGITALVMLTLLWLGDLVLGHIALWGDGGRGGADCPHGIWWGALGCMAATNYPYILQALITNK